MRVAFGIIRHDTMLRDELAFHLQSHIAGIRAVVAWIGMKKEKE
jgi:hypothetical protein